MLGLEDILGSVGVVNTLDLDQTGLGVRCVAVTLVGKVTTPVIPPLSVPLSSINCESFLIRGASWACSSRSSPRNIVLLAVPSSSRPRLSSIPFQAPHFAFGPRPSGRERANNRASMQLTSRKLESQEVSYRISGWSSRETAVLVRPSAGRRVRSAGATGGFGAGLTSVTSF
jgi:hypothetical protein